MAYGMLLLARQSSYRLRVTDIAVDKRQGL